MLTIGTRVKWSESLHRRIAAVNAAHPHNAHLFQEPACVGVVTAYQPQPAWHVGENEHVWATFDGDLAGFHASELEIVE